MKMKSSGKTLSKGSARATNYSASAPKSGKHGKANTSGKQSRKTSYKGSY